MSKLRVKLVTSPGGFILHVVGQRGRPASDATAMSLFDTLNARYWGGRLPRYRVLHGHLDGALGLCVDTTRTIMLDRTLTGEALELVLLHEMAHIGSVGAAHGPQFKQEVRRLLRLGAPPRLLDDLERYDTGRVVNPSLTGEPS